MKKFAVALVASALAVIISQRLAYPLPQFMAEFKAMYIKPDGTEKEKALAAAFEKSKCNTCHGKNAEGKDDKKVRNVYGAALGKLLKKEDAMNKEKIIKSLEQIESEKPKADGPTFGELLKGGKLPAGT